MALRAPPALIPSVGAMGQLLEIDRVDARSSENSGLLNGVTTGWPRWMMSIDLNNMRDRDAKIWRAFLRARRGLQRGLMVYDLWRPFPAAHAGGFAQMTTIGGAPFTGAASAWSQTIDPDTADALLRLEGLPAGLELDLDDFIGLKWDVAGWPAGNHYGRTMVSVTTGGRVAADGTLTVTVEPPVPTGVVPVGAIAHLDMACCIMKLDTTQTKLGRKVLNGVTEAGSKIVANQDLRL